MVSPHLEEQGAVAEFQTQTEEQAAVVAVGAAQTEEQAAVGPVGAAQTEEEAAPLSLPSSSYSYSCRTVPSPALSSVVDSGLTARITRHNNTPKRARLSLYRYFSLIH